ncbi:MAG TPA: hypothetical protein VGL77_01065 [Armatimonadota bacterium]|jgi:hypothetical protein
MNNPAAMPHFQKGKELLYAFVFSCPGADEEDAGYPAAGVTGTVLNILLNELRTEAHSRGYIFHGKLDRESISITNAWKKVECIRTDDTGKKCGRTEAGIDEILDERVLIDGESSLARLERELGRVTDTIFCCGDRAESAVTVLLHQKRLPHTCRVIVIPHLTTRRLNSAITYDRYGTKIVSAKKAHHVCDQHSRKLLGEANTRRRVVRIAESIVDVLLNDGCCHACGRVFVLKYYPRPV